PAINPNIRFMVSWTSQILSPTQAPNLRKLDALNFYLFPENVFPIGHSFSVGGFTDLPILPAGGNLDVGPSSGISSSTDVVAISNGLRTATDRGLIYELEAGASLTNRVRCCDDLSGCATENCAIQVFDLATLYRNAE